MTPTAIYFAGIFVTFICQCFLYDFKANGYDKENMLIFLTLSIIASVLWFAMVPMILSVVVLIGIFKLTIYLKGLFL